MRPTFVIDALPARAQLYRRDHAIVAIDVFRASTTIVTALAGGRRVFPVPTVDAARQLGRDLAAALLAGEQAGIQPDGFDLQNSPSEVERLHDRRPLVLVSSAGTVLLASALGAPAIYVGCFRNLAATAEQLAELGHSVALIGAGTRGESRAEDQMACAWLGRRLQRLGFEPEDGRTDLELHLWGDIDLASLREGPSAAYLKETGQDDDIDFVLSHLDDVDAAAEFDGREVRLVEVGGATAEAETA